MAEPYSNSPPCQQRHSLIMVNPHFLNKDFELGARKWLRERVGNHELCGDIPDGNAPSLNQLSSVLILNIDMLGAQVSVRILHKSKHTLIVTVNDQRALKLDTEILQ